MKKILSLSVALSLAVGSCASYKPRLTPVPREEAMPVWHVEDTVAVGVDPYVEEERQESVFDANLNQVGVIPVQVFIQNRGERPLLIRASDMILILEDGSQVGSAGASAVVAKLEKPSHHFCATACCGLPGGLASMSSSDIARANRQVDYQIKKFRDATLRKGESRHGFLYFIPPLGTKAFNEATLGMYFVDVEKSRSFAVSLSLTKLDFKGDR